MPTANSSASKEVVTAALLVIGGKILSGRTKDQNVGYIAEYLTAVGINLKEVRVVGDEESAIVDALNALRHRCTYVFTTGGIGPTTVTSPPTAWRRRSVCRSTAIRARSPSCTNG
jgi:molybdopterin biosynthesis enzyme MoaB